MSEINELDLIFGKNFSFRCLFGFHQFTGTWKPMPFTLFCTHCMKTKHLPIKPLTPTPEEVKQ